jgi:phosphoribosylaminoimidazole carboxylase (NCAIR synthetase)
MADATLLVLGNTVITTWGRDQIRRLSEQARRRGVALIGADTPENLRAASPQELARVDEVVALDVNDPEACRAWAAGRPAVDGVLTIRELAVYSTAVLAKELGLAGNDPEAVARIRNKDLARQRLREHGFAQPSTALCGDLADAERFLADTGPGPWIVKPRDGLASIGVSLVTGADELAAAVAKFGAPPPAMGNLPASPTFLVETFVPGAEFSAEGVVMDGVPRVLALVRKTVTDGFIETGHRTPAGLPDATAEAAADAVARAVRAVGITRGIFHVEFWVNDSGIVLGELHDRPAGDYIHALIEHTRPGFELYGALVDDLLGLAPQTVPPASGAAAAEFLLIPPGRLRAVHGWDDLSRHPDVFAADLWVAPGDAIAPVVDAFGRHGAFVVGAASAEEADRTVRELTATLRFEHH